jgi:hypothetical protein
MNYDQDFRCLIILSFLIDKIEKNSILKTPSIWKNISFIQQLYHIFLFCSLKKNQNELNNWQNEKKSEKRLIWIENRILYKTDQLFYGYK